MKKLNKSLLAFLFLFLSFCNVNSFAQEVDLLTLQGTFELPKLGYDYDELEPAIDEETMEIHYSKHHQAYVNNLNKALAESEFKTLNLGQLLRKASALSPAIRNNAGGHFNHSLFWKLLRKPNKNNQPTAEVLKSISKNFGSFEEFKKQFETAGLGQFGSGWAWLVKSPSGKLQISSTLNQDNPLMNDVKVRGTPILAIDIWEHAYYLKYQNRRADYLAAIWSVINWDQVEVLLKK